MAALAGPNGAGKTTLLNPAVGPTAPSAGAVIVPGGLAARVPGRGGSPGSKPPAVLSQGAGRKR